MAMAKTDEQRVRDVIEGNPAYRELYCSLVAFCAKERTVEEAQSFCEERRISKAQILSGAAMVDAMVRAGALARRTFVDGDLYEGALEELQADEAIPEDAQIAVFVQATEAGAEAASAVSDERSFERLAQAHPSREDAFRAVLGWCAEEQGKTTRQLQELLKGNDLLETEAARGIDGLHASYFTGSLESVGALAWNGKAWIATEKGRALVGR
ncbi:hypothetical protein VJ923_01965 [Adlercreutzia sp. R25]|uniref:hypothetical protein n=1 Tax=Adlercreutzia shanghongiae TaxID=3111773 RepID=UPI002DBD191E|nr:hypothetical protein [Adlercreutzia sp. R25]MEC4271926.1 hypothetical protein [Adlercreutzia sp. R25]